MRRPRTYAAKLALAGVTVGVALGGVGLAGRLLRGKTPRPEPAYGLQLRDDAGRLLGQPHGPLQMRLDPFTVYRSAPNQCTDHFTIDPQGWRGPGARGAGAAIVLLGGSAVFGQELAGDGETCAAQLEALLPGTPVLNAGVAGFLSGQELAAYVHHLRGTPARAVVVVDGWNELFDQWQCGPRADERFGFNNTFFQIADRLAAAAPADGAALRPAAAAPDDERYLQKLFDAYAANVHDIQRMAAARGAEFLWALQPELGGKPGPTVEEAKILAGWDRTYGYLRRDFPRRYAWLRARAVEYAAQHRLPCVDVGAEPEFAQAAGVALFHDPVHPNAEGQRRLAAVLARKLGGLPEAGPLAQRAAGGAASGAARR